MQAPFDLDRIGGHRGLSNLVDEVLAAGAEARLLYRSGAGTRFKTKADRSPVTDADRAVEERLRLYLQARFPDAAFLGEETGESEGSTGLRFVVDPIDGTRAFIRGLPTWSVLVGIEADGEPAVGIAYMPILGELFVGAIGHGARVNGRPVHLSEVDSLEHATISHGGLQQFTESGMGAQLLRLSESTYTARGFADFDGYRQLLLGRVDAMIDPGIKPYDVCPAAVLVREAGGRFTDVGGRETIHGGSGLASNGRVHDELVALLGG